MVLWKGFDSTWFQLNRTVRWNREGTNHVFYEFNSEGNGFLEVAFLAEEHYNKHLQEAETIYMVAMPLYHDVSMKIGMLEEVRKQAYYVTGNDWYYFRVTEEQYMQLTYDYIKSEEHAKEDIKKVRYTYEELLLQLK